MEISLNTAYICTIGSMERTLKAFKNAGFSNYDFSSSYLIPQCDLYIDKEDYKDRAKHLREYADSLNLKCNQSHSFMKYIEKNLSKEENNYRWTMLLRSIDIASILGAPYIVVHPFSTYSLEQNVVYFKELSKYAKNKNIKIAIENVPGGFFSDEYQINELLNKINDDFVVLCLDIGHAEMPKETKTCAVNIIKSCAKYLKCLHVHDNDKVNDLHILPGQGKIDFGEIFDALKEINYQGDLTFEVDGYIFDNFPNEKRDNSLSSIYKCGQELLNKYY